MYEFKLPDLGEGIAEAEILEWHVDVGGLVGEDEPLVEVETDKATVTIPSPVAGRVVQRSGEVGDTVNVGQVLVILEVAGEESEAAGKAESPPVEAKSDERNARESGTPQQPAVRPRQAFDGDAADVSGRGKGPVPAAPATRRLARELGVDIALVPGTGPAGRVTPADVTRFASEAGSGKMQEAPSAPRGEESAFRPERRNDKEPSSQVEKEAATTSTGQTGAAVGLPYVQLESMPDFERWGPVERIAFRSIRRKVARKMATVSVLVPQVTHTDEADITDIERVRHRINERLVAQGRPKVTVTAMVVRALPALLRKYPMFNASLDWEHDELILKRYYNIGVAADSPKGLVVPVVQGADGLSLTEVAAAILDLGSRAREDRLDAGDFQGGTFTVSNIGALGGFSPNPIINYPEVALLGMGQAKDRPVVRDGEILVRRMMPLALTFDHRVADGADAARMLGELVSRLQDPDEFLASI